MATCSKCLGTGQVIYDEDGRRITDACYHCSTTGQVDEDIAWCDRLHDVALALAEREEREYRKVSNEDPQGDGYDLFAAENMMSTWDYFKTRVWDRAYKISEKLGEMDLASQQLLVGWNEQPIA